MLFFFATWSEIGDQEKHQNCQENNLLPGQIQASTVMNLMQKFLQKYGYFCKCQIE